MEFDVVANSTAVVEVACTNSPNVVALSGIGDVVELAGSAMVP